MKHEKGTVHINYRGAQWSPETVKLICLRVWTAAAKYTKADEEGKKLRKQQLRQKRAKEAQDFTYAYRTQEWFQVRQMAGYMGGTYWNKKNDIPDM